MLLVLNLPLARVWARLLQIPAYGIYAGILVFATLGTFASGGGLPDLLVLYVIGLLGVLMTLAGVPVAPAVVGLILGPLFETQLRRSLLISQGDLSEGLFGTNLAIVLWVIAGLAVAVPFAWTRLRRTAEATAPDDAEV